MNEHQLRTLCGPWPGVEFDVKWGDDFVASVDGKMFAICRRGSTADRRLCFKVADDRFLALTDQPGIEPAPYLARAHWVLLRDAAGFNAPWLAAAITESYRLVAARLSRKRRRELGIE